MPEKKNRQSTRISANRVPNHSLTSPRQNRRVSCCSRNRSAERWTRASALADTCRIHFFCERRSASQASRRALAISRETDLWEVESEGTRCDWLRFAWIGGLFQIRRNSKKKYCRKGFLLLPCSLREASQAFGLLLLRVTHLRSYLKALASISLILFSWLIFVAPGS